MVAQLRTYTINRGMMDSWLKVFNEEIRPIHDKIGMPISATFVNADRNEFIWIRNFNSADEIPEKEAAYFASDERKTLGDKPTSHIAKIEVKVIETVLQPAGRRLVCLQRSKSTRAGEFVLRLFAFTPPCASRRGGCRPP